MKPSDTEQAGVFADRLARLNQVLYEADLGRPFTDQEIADRIGLSVSQVANLRHGRSLPRADRAHRLAQLYGVRSEFFFLPADAPYVGQVEAELRAIEAERRGLPHSRVRRSAGASPAGPPDRAATSGAARSASNEGATGTAEEEEEDERVRRIAEGVAELPADMRETVATLVDQLRRAVSRRPGRPNRSNR
ncbi:helix-turn-helix domain-containing protein [Streptomyces sp. PTM05]|uniref:Helix-turn-helix domain-containing protein n=1 Tax=Streptantibioticus parmotrematis TaxID=2873249 RepID=A0ABS7QYA8_9ACTN|nr:helix-turn-helix transcriptional regulator [Streptantibioticus parmotrematis]MBY8888201.1 helix-turn-helix domain-containing protein [Streptantibioticus parmotrematis]